MTPEHYFPTSNPNINQAWGIKNPSYQQFAAPGEVWDSHNGVDWATAPNKVWRYPWNGTGTVVRTGNQPTGGGIFLGVLSNEDFTFPDGKVCRILTDCLHAERLLLKEGDQVTTGTPCIIQDNTGFSTGPHTHEQDRRVDKNLNNIDFNTAHNSFDPMVYNTGKYAETVLLEQQQIINLTALIAKLKALLSLKISG